MANLVSFNVVGNTIAGLGQDDVIRAIRAVRDEVNEMSSRLNQIDITISPVFLGAENCRFTAEVMANDERVAEFAMSNIRVLHGWASDYVASYCANPAFRAIRVEHPSKTKSASFQDVVQQGG